MALSARTALVLEESREEPSISIAVVGVKRIFTARRRARLSYEAAIHLFLHVLQEVLEERLVKRGPVWEPYIIGVRCGRQRLGIFAFRKCGAFARRGIRKFEKYGLWLLRFGQELVLPFIEYRCHVCRFSCNGSGIIIDGGRYCTRW